MDSPGVRGAPSNLQAAPLESFGCRGIGLPMIHEYHVSGSPMIFRICQRF
jgi:hypothetical protein